MIVITIIIVLVVLADYGTRCRGSWLRVSNGQKMLFRSPIGGWLTMAGVAGFFFLCPFLFDISSPSSASDWVDLTLYLVFFWGLAYFCLWIGRSQELEIDLQERTYQRRLYWLPWLVWEARRGSLDEFVGIRWSSRKGRHVLFLSFSGRPPLGYTIGRFVDVVEIDAAAKQVAQQVAQAVGLPVLGNTAEIL